MPIIMPAVVDSTLPDGSDGTAVNLAIWTALGAAIDLATVPGTSAPTTTGTQTALAIPSGGGPLILYLNNATLLTIQGIAAGLSGQRLTLISKGAGQVDLAHLHASGTALGKLKLFATTGLTSLAAGSGVAAFQYDATVTQWRLVSHEQGAWITPTFAAGDFTGNASMTWTVASGDRTAFGYRLRGKDVTVAWTVGTSTVGGTPNSQLQIGNAQWGGFTAAREVFTHAAWMRDNNVLAEGMLQVAASGTIIAVRRSDLGNFSAATDTTYVYGSITFEVT